MMKPGKWKFTNSWATLTNWKLNCSFSCDTISKKINKQGICVQELLSESMDEKSWISTWNMESFESGRLRFISWSKGK